MSRTVGRATSAKSSRQPEGIVSPRQLQPPLQCVPCDAADILCGSLSRLIGRRCCTVLTAQGGRPHRPTTQEVPAQPAQPLLQAVAGAASHAARRARQWLHCSSAGTASIAGN